MTLLNPLQPLIDLLQERIDAPQTSCDQCGRDFPEGHVVWLEGPHGTGQWLCKKHYEQELTEGRGRR